MFTSYSIVTDVYRKVRMKIPWIIMAFSLLCAIFAHESQRRSHFVWWRGGVPYIWKGVYQRFVRGS